METLALEKLALDIFENKESYKNIDFIVIMNILMEEYNKLKGLLSLDSNIKENQCELDNCCNVLYEDGLCWNCFNQRELEEGSDSDESDADYFGNTALDFY